MTPTGTNNGDVEDDPLLRGVGGLAARLKRRSRQRALETPIMTPTQLTLRKLKADGYQAQVVEHWNNFARVRTDLFGFIDVLALKGDETLAIQATTAPNALARVHKIANSDLVAAVREAGWTLRVWGWAKPAGRWTLTKDIDCS